MRASRGMRHRLREAVEQALAPRPPADLPHHLALLELSKGQDGGVRLLTTIRHAFRAVVGEWRRVGASEPCWPGDAPAGNGAFEGVLHLHGRIEDRDLHLNGTDLVLTSPEFGDAISQVGLGDALCVRPGPGLHLGLVGYRADDPPMRLPSRGCSRMTVPAIRTSSRLRVCVFAGRR